MSDGSLRIQDNSFKDYYGFTCNLYEGAEWCEYKNRNIVQGKGWCGQYSDWCSIDMWWTNFYDFANYQGQIPFILDGLRNFHFSTFALI